MHYINLTQGKQTIVDEEDVELLRKYKWCFGIGYAYSKINRKSTLLHRLLLKPDAGYQIDHINGNKLDNRRNNLRLCTQQQNLRNRPKLRTNTSGYKGVTKCRKMWKAQIYYENKVLNLGHFITKEEAAIAYNKAAETYYGEFAFLNIIK